MFIIIIIYILPGLNWLCIFEMTWAENSISIKHCFLKCLVHAWCLHALLQAAGRVRPDSFLWGLPLWLSQMQIHGRNGLTDIHDIRLQQLSVKFVRKAHRQKFKVQVLKQTPNKCFNNTDKETVKCLGVIQFMQKLHVQL